MNGKTCIILLIIFSRALALNGLTIQAEGGWDNEVGNSLPYFMALNCLLPLSEFNSLDAGVKYRFQEPGIDAVYLGDNFEFNIKNSFTFGFWFGDCLFLRPGTGPVEDHLFLVASFRAGFISIYTGAESPITWETGNAVAGFNWLYRVEFHIFTYSGILSPFMITLGFADFYRYEYSSLLSPLSDLVFTCVFNDTVVIDLSGRIKHIPGLFAGSLPEFSATGDVNIHF
jgi:hypothetical protein